MTALRRRFVLSLACLRLACLGLACLPAGAPADDYPARPVELVVPFAAGGGTDLLARMLADGLGKRLKQTFVVVNRPGANTNLGTQTVVRSKSDGTTLVMASIGLTANPSLYKRLPFVPLNDLVPITLLANSPHVLVVHPSVPADTLAELISLLKAKPGEFNYASYGAGSGPHLAAELFQSMTGTRMVGVPYPGGGQAAMAVVGNTVHMLFAGFLPVLGLIRNGSVRPIAYASDARSPLLPELPTFAESGVAFKAGTWFGLLAPAKTPADIIAKLHTAAVETLRDPAVVAKLTEQGAEIVANSPAEFRAFIKEETDRLSVVIRAANIELD
jgi:tripartite-type tricarboxylate transporter receptor subunit TctC